MIGPSESAGKKVSAPTSKIVPTSNVVKSGPETGNVPALVATTFFSGQRTGEREDRHDHGKAAKERSQSEGGVIPGRIAAEPANALPLFPVHEL